jgi:hypothetical protein
MSLGHCYIYTLREEGGKAGKKPLWDIASNRRVRNLLGCCSFCSSFG